MFVCVCVHKSKVLRAVPGPETHYKLNVDTMMWYLNIKGALHVGRLLICLRPLYPVVSLGGDAAWAASIYRKAKSECSRAQSALAV